MPEVSAAPRPAGRGLRIALLVSVGLNLAVAGFVVGAVLDRDGPPIRSSLSDMAREVGLGPYVAALSRADRLAIGRAVRADVRAIGGPRALHAEMRGSFAEVLAALRAEPFDALSLSALLAAQVERAEARRRIGQDALVARLASMSAAERRAFADRLEAQLTRRHEGRGERR